MGSVASGDNYLVDVERRLYAWRVKRRRAELAQAQDDPERVLNAARMISGTLDARAIDLPSEFAKREAILSCESSLSEIATTLDQISKQSPKNLVPEAIADARATLNLPLAQCAAIIRSDKKKEGDFEHLLAAFRKEVLRIEADPKQPLDTGNQLDAYILEVLFREHVTGGKIRLQGDLQNLKGLSDEEIGPAIVRAAKARKAADEDGSRDLERVTAPGEEIVGRRLDALMHAHPEDLDVLLHSLHDREDLNWLLQNAFSSANLADLDDRFPGLKLDEPATVMAGAIIEASSREDCERVCRKAGVKGENAKLAGRFLARVLARRAALSENPEAAGLILQHAADIGEAMARDKAFMLLFG